MAPPRNPVPVVVAVMLFTMTLWLVQRIADRGLAHVGRLREGSGLAMSQQPGCGCHQPAPLLLVAASPCVRRRIGWRRLASDHLRGDRKSVV